MGMMAKAFAGVDVADVHFDRGNLRSADGVAKRDAGVGEGSRIENDPLAALIRQFRDLIDKRTFVIRLVEFEVDFGELLAESVGEIVQSARSVDFRFAFAEAIQVGSVQDSDTFHRRLSTKPFVAKQ